MINWLFAAVIPGSNNEATGAVGKRFVAILEAMGVFAQSEIIEVFTPMLTSIGGLVYIVSGISFIVLLALYGDFRKALHLLVGPPLFLWILTSTVPGGATNVQVGSRVEQDIGAQNLAFLSFFSPTYLTTPKVTWLFKQFDQLVSSVVQGSVAVLIDEVNRKDLVSAARDNVFGQLFRGGATDPGFTKLVSKGVVGRCAESTQLQQELASLRLSKAAAGSPEAAEAEIKRQQLSAVRNEKRILLDSDEQQFAMMVGRSAGEVSEPVSCGFVWGLVHQASLKLADETFRRLTNNGDPNSRVPWGEVQKAVRAAVTGDPSDQGKVNQVVAAYIVKNSLTGTAHSALMSQLGTHAPMVASKYGATYDNQAFAQGQGMLVRITTFAATVPYIQGLLLFLLAAAFPFFTVFLLMPNRMGDFFTWMWLWLWVKSWDIGFAVVDVLKDLLFPFIGSSVDSIHSINQSVNWSDPVVAFQIISNSDPVANYNTYLMVIGTLTLAVPAFTAHLCNGSSRLLSAFSQSLESRASGFGAMRTGAVRRNWATRVQANIRWQEGDAMLEAAGMAGENPGYTEAGVNRWFSGQGTVPRYMAQAGTAEGYRAGFSSELAIPRAELGEASSRPMTYMGTMGDNLLVAEHQRMSQKLWSAPPMFGGVSVPLIGSDRYRNDSFNINTVPKPTPGGDGVGEGDGGGGGG